MCAAALPCVSTVQEERRQQEELKRKQDEEAVRQYRKKLRFSVSIRRSLQASGSPSITQVSTC